MSNIEAIQNIFQEILPKIRKGAFKDLLCAYQTILLEEDAFLEQQGLLAFAAKKHPLFCALDLKLCLMEYEKYKNHENHFFFKALAGFEMRATNTEFYPRIRIATAIISAILLTFSIALLIGFLLGTATPIGALLMAAGLATMMISTGYFALLPTFMSDYFVPISSSEALGNRFFSMFNQSANAQNEEILESNVNNL